ncbi:hypothetical protein [Pseudochryseolinea flava]|uniref:DUF4142 domain-containing protein n=1 Tax=Pseudochryseolinea flava TaxID=2059302 RepID=A0A364XX37_9BACT|nr:hypothetical protein [Pseudochryseolinea flava]RAV98851.1 hypothetical protein DQQ10_21345 [Pseudochryseolinea flava]
MKIVLISIVVLSMTSATCQAQFEEKPNQDELTKQNQTQIKYLFQQIAQLQLYHSYVKQGMTIVRGGLRVIHTIKNGKFELDENVLAALGHTKAVINSDPRAKAVAASSRAIAQSGGNVQTICSSGLLNLGESQYARAVMASLLKSARENEAHFVEINRDRHFEMTDDERLQQLQMAFDHAQRLVGFARVFEGNLRLVVNQRHLESDEIKRLNRLNQEHL